MTRHARPKRVPRIGALVTWSAAGKRMVIGLNADSYNIGEIVAIDDRLGWLTIRWTSGKDSFGIRPSYIRLLS